MLGSRRLEESTGPDRHVSSLVGAGEGGGVTSIVIEASKGRPYRLPWQELLSCEFQLLMSKTCDQTTLLTLVSQVTHCMVGITLIFPEKEYRGLSPNFHIHASMSDLYISTIGPPFLLEEISRPILGLYKSLTDT
jgi:hypothetical protein